METIILIQLSKNLRKQISGYLRSKKLIYYLCSNYKVIFNSGRGGADWTYTDKPSRFQNIVEISFNISVRHTAISNKVRIENKYHTISVHINQQLIASLRGADGRILASIDLHDSESMTKLWQLCKSILQHATSQYEALETLHQEDTKFLEKMNNDYGK